jgi:hypothetical protein
MNSIIQWSGGNLTSSEPSLHDAHFTPVGSLVGLSTAPFPTSHRPGPFPKLASFSTYTHPPAPTTHVTQFFLL